MAQWLRLHTSNAGGMGSVLGKGVKILHAMQPKRKINLNKYIYVLCSGITEWAEEQGVSLH